MSIQLLIDLEARLNVCVSGNDSDGIRESVIRLCSELSIPSEGDPTRIDRAKPIQALIERCARSILRVSDPEPASLCAELLWAAFAERVVTSDTCERASTINHALNLARRGTSRATLRRALNISAAVALQTGEAGLGLKYAMQSCAIAKELGDERGVAAALANFTGILSSLGDYRHTIEYGRHILCAFASKPELQEFMQCVRSNMASSFFALRQYGEASILSRVICEEIANPKMRNDHWRRSIAEIIWLRCAVAVNDASVVAARMRYIGSPSRDLESPRTEMMRQQALSVYDGFVGRHTSAIERLMETCAVTHTMPSLHVDTLTLLVEAHQRVGDCVGALRCLAEQVAFQSRWHIKQISAKLTTIRDEILAASSAHDEAATLISAIQKQSRNDSQRNSALPATAMQETFERLAVAAELSEDDSGRHIYRVGRLTGLLAAEIGHGAESCDRIERAARLHDIGKLGLPSALVARPETLSVAETRVMHEHTEIGRKILAQANDPTFDLAGDIAYSHRERWDGRGYPQRLKRAAIPEAARMVALAEAFDVLTHGREYQAPVKVPEALARIEQASGTQFEPRLVTAFINVINRLHRENNNDDSLLSDYLGNAGTASSFLQARESMRVLMGTLAA